MLTFPRAWFLPASQFHLTVSASMSCMRIIQMRLLLVQATQVSRQVTTPAVCVRVNVAIVSFLKFQVLSGIALFRVQACAFTGITATRVRIGTTSMTVEFGLCVCITENKLS